MENQNEEDKKAEISKILQALSNYKRSFTDYDSLESLEERLGPPDSVETKMDDGFEIITKVWINTNGENIEICYINPPAEYLEEENEMERELRRFKYTIKEVDDDVLNSLLAQSLEAEDFESAVVIRDEFERRKK